MSPAASALAAHECRLLGTSARIAVTDAAALDAAVAAVLHEVAAIDDSCSRFRDDSELAMVNAQAGEQVHISPLLASVVGEALRAARLSEGTLDPTIGRSVAALGYDVDFRRIASGDVVALRMVPAAGYRTVHLDRVSGVLRLPAGVTLDLDVVAKAIAVDRAVAAAHRAGGVPVVVEIGGDLAVAGVHPDGEWVIQASAASTAAPVQLITIRDGAVATSGTTERRWRRGGQDVHHILNPATGHPADEIFIAVSVAGKSCLDANIAATTAIIRGEGAVAWLTKWGLPARLVRRDGSVTHLNNWPATGEAA